MRGQGLLNLDIDPHLLRPFGDRRTTSRGFFLPFFFSLFWLFAFSIRGFFLSFFVGSPPTLTISFFLEFFIPSIHLFLGNYIPSSSWIVLLVIISQVGLFFSFFFLRLLLLFLPFLFK